MVGSEEKTPVFSTQKRRNPVTGRAYSWIVRSTSKVDDCYFLWDRRGVRPVLPQVLHLLSLQRQALHQRP